MEHGNQPLVFPTYVEMDMATAGYTSADFASWGAMPFFEFNADGNPVPGAGMMTVDGSWGLTVTVHYYGNDADTISALENSTLDTATDGTAIKAAVESAVSAENMSDVEISLEAMKMSPPVDGNMSPEFIINLGDIDVENSGFFNGTSPNQFTIVESVEEVVEEEEEVGVWEATDYKLITGEEFDSFLSKPRTVCTEYLIQKTGIHINGEIYDE